jgi:Peptidase family M49
MTRARWQPDWAGIVLVSTAILLGSAPVRARSAPDLRELKKLVGRLAPVDLTADVDRLPANERAALAQILRAAQMMDPLFLRQVWAGNEALLMELTRDVTAPAIATPFGEERLHAMLQNKGPWLRLDEERPFLPGIGEKPAPANFYPADATKADLERWIKDLPAAARAAAGGFFTTIRRGPDGHFLVVPYSVEYQGELVRAAGLLRAAAALTTQPSLRRFLEARAGAFLSDDYYASDVAWMQLDASIEPTIGPYEVYEDGWFSAKAAFEAFVALRDDAETEKLVRFAHELQDLEDHLPIDPRLRNPKLGALAPIRVVNSIFCAGDANRGIQTAAFNLPNDEKIEREMGTKRVMLKNVQEAKFRMVLLPIAQVALAPADRKNVGFEPFFTHILMHELMHGLGPHDVTAGAGTGARPTTRGALQETYGPIEEAKADVSGLWALGYLVDKGVLDRGFERAAYTTFLASMFRAIRFGLKEAHGRSVALQLNTFLDAGAVVVAKDGTFSVDAARMKEAVRALTATLMNLEAAGDHAQAVELLRTRAVIRPPVQRVLDRLSRVPVDIELRFPTAQKLLAQFPE